MKYSVESGNDMFDSCIFMGEFLGIEEGRG